MQQSLGTLFTDRAIDIIITVIVTLFGSSGIWLYFTNRKKNDAEAKKVIVEAQVIASDSAIKNMCTAMEVLSKRLSESNDELSACKLSLELKTAELAKTNEEWIKCMFHSKP